MESPMPDEQNMYELICKREFETLHKEIDEVLRLLRGYNDKQGLVDRVRRLDRGYKTVLAAIVFVVTVLGVQLAAWLFDKL